LLPKNIATTGVVDALTTVSSWSKKSCLSQILRGSKRFVAIPYMEQELKGFLAGLLTEPKTKSDGSLSEYQRITNNIINGTRENLIDRFIDAVREESSGIVREDDEEVARKAIEVLTISITRIHRFSSTLHNVI